MPPLAALAALACLGTACSLLVDRSVKQCQNDDDCESKFPHHGHPTCQSQVCVSLEYAPADCFLSTPARPPRAPEDFLNACSTTYLPDPGRANDQCLSFDNVDAGIGPGDGGPSVLNAPPTPDGGAATGAGTASTDAGTPPLCKDQGLGGGVIYLSGSSNFLALLAKIAPTIIAKTGRVPVFRTTDSCTGARSMYPCKGAGAACSNGFSQNDHYIRDPAPGSAGTYAQYYNQDGDAFDCLLGGEIEVDIGESEIFAETCGLSKDPDNVSHIPGPILPILFVVPRRSRQTAISAEAAREILGDGARIEPWINPGQFYIRGPGTATTRLIGLAIGVPVPPNRFWGNDQGSAQTLAKNLKLVADPVVAQQAIGILGADSYDSDRFNLKALGFQAMGQKCAYVPDSTLSSYDKRNVRDGHYPIWGTVHFFAAVAGGLYRSQAAQDFLGLFQSPVAEALLDAFIDSGWVPECAMMVQHESDLKPPTTSNPPAYPCGCYFESRVPGGKAPAGCKPCQSDADCAAGTGGKTTCNFHFCELPPPL